MSPQDFCYWLQGYFELNGSTALTPEQVQIIQEHLKLVFYKKTPNIPDTTDNPVPVCPYTWAIRPDRAIYCVSGDGARFCDYDVAHQD